MKSCESRNVSERGLRCLSSAEESTTPMAMVQLGLENPQAQKSGPP